MRARHDPWTSATKSAHGRTPRRRRRQSISQSAALRLRLKVFLSRGRLDREICAGCPHESSAPLALRAQQLTDPRMRERLARNLRGTVEYVEHVGSRRGISAVVTNRAAVWTGREALLGLAERLEATDPVTPKGVVLARALLTDGSSPLYNPYCERTVAEAVWEVADLLGPEEPTIEFDAVAC